MTMYSSYVDRFFICRVSPFGNPRIAGCFRLTVAYRRSLRPSSAPGAKAFPLRSFQLDQLQQNNLYFKNHLVHSIFSDWVVSSTIKIVVFQFTLKNICFYHFLYLRFVQFSRYITLNSEFGMRNSELLPFPFFFLCLRLFNSDKFGLFFAAVLHRYAHKA